MGRSKSRRVVDDEDDAEVVPFDFKARIPYKPVEYYLEELFNKKCPKREKAMESIVEVLTNSTFKSEVDFMESNFATFLYRSLNLFRKGSVKELQSSSQAIGLLAMIIDDEDDANEIFREVFPVVSKALKSGPKALKVLDCLALSTFFGASNAEETQAAMQMIRALLLPESESEFSAEKRTPDALVAVISAWVFLLSSLERWGISSKYWQGMIPFFLSLLENGDQSVSAAAGSALALIFETECEDKFVTSEDRSTGESSTSNTYSSIKETVKDRILEKVERLCLEQKAANNVIKQQLRILDYFKNGCCPKVSTSIGRGTLELSSWSKIIQFNYLKSFLGNRGLNAHLLENRKLQAIFGFSEKKGADRVPRKELYEPIVEEVTVNCYLPRERDFSLLQKKDRKKDRLMRGALVDKAQTKLRSKNRELAMERKMTFGFDF